MSCFVAVIYIFPQTSFNQIQIEQSFHMRYVWQHKIAISTEGRKNFFYLTMHLTHFIYGYMVKDHSDSLTGLLFLISSKGSFICTIPQTGGHMTWSTGWNEK